MVVESQTWVALVGFAGFTLALASFLLAFKRDLKAEIGGVRADLKAEIGGVRADLKSEIGGVRADLKSEIGGLNDKIGKVDDKIGKVDDKIDRIDEKVDRTRGELMGVMTAGFAEVNVRLTELESRTYDISKRLPAAPASASTS